MDLSKKGIAPKKELCEVSNQTSNQASKQISKQASKQISNKASQQTALEPITVPCHDIEANKENVEPRNKRKGNKRSKSKQKKESNLTNNARISTLQYSGEDPQQPIGNPLAVGVAAPRQIMTRSAAKAAQARQHYAMSQEQKTKRFNLGSTSTAASTAAASPVATATAAALIVPVPVRARPADVLDFDRENVYDPLQTSFYVSDIFNYLKSREPHYIIFNYMPMQVCLTPWMRAMLVDWMVEVQETFERYHETLYLAVKIVDMYLCRESIIAQKFQLLGVTAFFIACKYDERIPPTIKDFLYVCDDAYERNEVRLMELKIIRAIKYDLGAPLSYQFLRRFAICGQVNDRTMALARYILELSLMDYKIVGVRESKKAAAALFMAMRMDAGQAWTPTLVYYTGYEVDDFAVTVRALNAGLHCQPVANLNTIYNKYSHKLFHKVTKVPLLSDLELLQGHDKSSGEHGSQAKPLDLATTDLGSFLH